MMRRAFGERDYNFRSRMQEFQTVELHSYTVFLAGSHLQIDALNYLLPTETQKREFDSNNCVITTNEEGKYGVSFHNQGLYSIAVPAADAVMMQWLISYRAQPPDFDIRVCYKKNNKNGKILF